MSRSHIDSKDFVGSISKDGKCATLQFEGEQGGLSASFEAHRLPELVLLLSHLATRSQQIQSGKPRTRYVLPADALVCKSHPDGEHAVLSLRLASGVQPNFRIKLDQISGLIESLQNVLRRQPLSKRLS